MKFNFEFSNLCGTVYKAGNVLFSKDGNTLISPVGNRVSLFDLVNHTSSTLPFETSKNVSRIVLSPDGRLLICADEDGRAILVNLQRKALLHKFNFKRHVYDIRFSPNGWYFAVTFGNLLQIWRTPRAETMAFAPFALYKTFGGHSEDITCIDWSADSRYLVTGSRDATARVYMMEPPPGYRPVALTAHRDRLISCFFAHESKDIYTVSHDGTILLWRHRTEAVVPPDSDSDSEMSQDGADDTDGAGEEEGTDQGDDGDESSPPSGEDGGSEMASDAAEADAETLEVDRWSLSLEDKHYFQHDHAKVLCCDLHRPSGVLVVGLTSGIFALYEMPDFNAISTLSISKHRLGAVSINSSGEWIALASPKLGQLVVWEWQSETYVLKQQGHFYDMSVLAYSPDGQLIATGGDDSRVKLWNASSGFCFVTFSEHAGGITGVAFTQNGQVVVSASLDGTLRAFDLKRYRNFRTFTGTHPMQFSCLAVDPSGEIVCAGSLDNFEIHMWSMQSGRLLEVLAGHEGPVASLQFCSTAGTMVSGSWDKTVRLWDVFAHKGTTEPLHHGSDIVAVSVRPDARQLATSGLDGQISFWDLRSSKQSGVINGRKDIGSGRKARDLVSAKSSQASKCFTSLCYSADGACMLAGGKSKFVCIYQIEQQVLLKRFCISSNRSIDGILSILNSKNMQEGGAVDLIEDDSDSDVEERIDGSLPGVSKGDFSSRRTAPEIRTKCVQFSPTGRAWAAASTEGLLVYSLDETFMFDPFDLDVEVTPATVLQTLAKQEFVKALVMAFRLNEKRLCQKVVEAIPIADVVAVVQGVPQLYVARLLSSIAVQLDTTPHIEFYVTWACSIFNLHGRYIQTNATAMMTALRTLQKSLTRRSERIVELCDENKYLSSFLGACRVEDTLMAVDDAAA